MSDNVVNDTVRRLVWSGFYVPDEIVEIVGEELFAPDEIKGESLREEVARQFAAKMVDEKGWPDVTDCDRLDRVFDLLNQQGIIALQNAGYTQSDGIDDVTEAYENERHYHSAVKGYCFYHRQDLERVVDGGDLYLSFGDIAGDDERGVEVGNQIKRVFEAAGFPVEWDGSLHQRLLLKSICWKRRYRTSQA